MGRVPCCDKNGLRKGPWTPEEDQKLIDFIQKHGHGSWRTLPKNSGLARCGKSCRLRWANYLRPDIKRGRFSFEEEETIIQLHSILGNKWSAIAARLPGRTDNEIKNYWNTHIRKRLLRSGIDPVTHTPRLNLLHLSSLLSTMLFNQPAQSDASRMLDIKPHLSTELLRIVFNILQSQYQKQNFIEHNHVQESMLHCQQTIPEQLLSSLLYNPSQFNDASQWKYNEESSCSLSESLVTADTKGSYENTEHIKSTSLYESPTANVPCEQYLYNDVDSMLSTPASSVSLDNSSAIINNSIEEDKDTYYSNFFDFQIPGLFDMNEFI